MSSDSPRLKNDHQLRVVVHKETNEIHIEGNRSGLEYLMEVCKAVIGQSPGANHWHLGGAFNTLNPDSPDLIICYQEKTGGVPPGK